MQKISTDKAPAALGPYSQGIEANGFVFTAGQIPADPATGKIPETVKEQAHRALSNLKAILDASGDVTVVSTTVYLTDMADFAEVNSVYAEYFPEPYPARSCVAVASLPKGVKIEVSAIAVKN